MEKKQTLEILGSQSCWNKNGVMISTPENCRLFLLLNSNNLFLIYLFYYYRIMRTSKFHFLSIYSQLLARQCGPSLEERQLNIII